MRLWVKKVTVDIEVLFGGNHAINRIYEMEDN